MQARRSDAMSVARVGLRPLATDVLREGLKVVLYGACLSAIQRAFDVVVQCLDRIFISRAVIDSKDEAHQWVRTRLDELIGGDARQFSIANRPESASNANPTFTPAPGVHWLFWRWRPLIFTRSRGPDSSPRGNLLGEGEMTEQISIATISLSAQPLHAFIDEARQRYTARDSARTVVYVGTQYGGWNRLHSRPLRALDSVIFDPAALDNLVKDLASYLDHDTERWYASRGLPYRRGYLLHGPPGTGKTSLTLALAGHFRLPVHLIGLGNPNMNDESLIDLLGNMPRRSILLLEDVDVAFPRRDRPPPDVSVSGQKSTVTPSAITPSGLLNALDGAAAQEGRVVIMTTNHRKHLDPALIRPGRVDLELPFALATTADLRQLYEKFYELAGDTRAATFAGQLPPGTFSIAQVQGYLMRHRDSPDDALDRIAELHS